jgi:hypothetical protein
MSDDPFHDDVDPLRAMFLPWGATPCGRTTQGRRHELAIEGRRSNTRVIESKCGVGGRAGRHYSAETERRGSDLKLSGTATPPLATFVALVHARRRPGDGGRAPGRGADRLLRPVIVKPA